MRKGRIPQKAGRAGCARIRRAFSGRRGRQAGLASLIVPLAGYVIQDLRKSDSTIKLLVQRTRTYLTRLKIDRQQKIDPAERVEILETRVAGEIQKTRKC